jgi:acetolactate synthase I/II/III large subunit
MKACDFIARYLGETAGIEHVFTFAGGTNAMILDSIFRRGTMKIVPMRHEENAALAADAYARVKRGPALALAMSGPGATNMMTGIAQSYFDSSPVLYLTGNVTTGTYKYDRPLRQLGYQETDIVSLVRPITKQAFFVDRLSRVAQSLREALRECVSGRPGPCMYDIPFDVQKLDVEDAELPKPYAAKTRTLFTEADFDSFVDLLAQAKKPLILAGGGIQVSGTADALAKFGRSLSLPVVESLLGRDAFPSNDPLYVGFIGSYGNRHANQVLAASDLVIALGSRIDSRQTADTKLFTRNKNVIHVDIDANVLQSTVETALGIGMDLKDFFHDFEALASVRGLRYSAPGEWLASIRRVKDILAHDVWAGPGPLNPKRFLGALSQESPAGAIYTVDVGSHQMWSAQCCEFKSGDRVLYSGGLGTMGYAIPAAIGAHHASPDSPLIAIVGDGGFQMSIPELQTIVEFGVPVKIVVMNNGMLGLMKNFQDENFEGRRPATVIGYSVPDIGKVSHAYGIPFRRLDADADVNEALDWLKKTPGPAILEAVVPKEWGPYPKVMPGSGLDRQRPEISEDVMVSVREALQ